MFNNRNTVADSQQVFLQQIDHNYETPIIQLQLYMYNYFTIELLHNMI